MSIRTTIEKNANAALVLIGILGFAIQGLLATWPEHPPTYEWVVILLGLGTIAFFFYREDKAYKKDPGIKEATVTAATDDLMNKFAEVLVSRVVDKVAIKGKEDNSTEVEALKAQIAELKLKAENVDG